MRANECPCRTHDLRPPTDWAALVCPGCKSKLAPLFPLYTHYARCLTCAVLYWDSGAGLVKYPAEMAQTLIDL